MDQMHNLQLPYLLGSQAQKHVTHNEALRRLDQLVQIAALSRTMPAAPPAEPAEGERYIVPQSPEGVWAGQAGKLVTFVEAGGGSLEDITSLGINAGVDETTRFAVAATRSCVNSPRIRAFTSRSEDDQSSSVVWINAPIIHGLRIMDAHGFRSCK